MELAARLAVAEAEVLVPQEAMALLPMVVMEALALMLRRSAAKPQALLITLVAAAAVRTRQAEKALGALVAEALATHRTQPAARTVLPILAVAVVVTLVAVRALS